MINIYEDIERYIEGDLQGHALADMETAIEENVNLKQEYFFRKEVDSAIQEENVMNLRSQLQQISTSQSPKSTATGREKRIQRRKSYVAAASLTLLLGIGGIGYFHMNSPKNPEEVFEEHYEPYQATISFRSGNEEINSLLVRAYQYYQEEKYTTALTLFDQILEQEQDMGVLLYSGISLMEIDRYYEAEQSFAMVVKNDNNLFIEQAKWYLAMCYIKTNEKTEAEKLLADLAQNSQFYDEQAEKVMRDLAKLEED
ncbi:MAG: hypothetical protein R6U04_09745 [Bacteroidales bacterium]